MSRVRVLIVEDHRVVAEGLQALLEDDPGIEVCQIAGSVAEAIDVASATQPDVVLLDYHLPDGSGAEAAARIRRSQRASALLFLSHDESELARVAAVEAGAAGYLYKAQAASDVVQAVHRVAAGEMLIRGPEIAELLAWRRRMTSMVENLTQRERDVLQLLADGLDNKAIAARLGVRYGTVRSHVNNLAGKLGAPSKLEAVARAAELGLIRR